MSDGATTIDACYLGLFSLFKADDLLGPVTFDGPPGAAADWPADVVYLGGTLDWQSSWRATGGLHRKEEFEIALVISTRQPGQDAAAARARATAFLNAVAQVMFDQRARIPDAPGLKWSELRMRQYVVAPADEGFYADILAGIYCTSNL